LVLFIFICLFCIILIPDIVFSIFGQAVKNGVLIAFIQNIYNTDGKSELESILYYSIGLLFCSSRSIPFVSGLEYTGSS